MSVSQPSNASEWQLYRVLQRANLLQYYNTFVAQGGDDVPQLCEAGEEEFLEIMALVGMASKPLHVRRLQKSLQEYVANPAGFQGTGNSPGNSVAREPPTHVYSLPNMSADTSDCSSTDWSTPQKRASPISMILSSRPVDLQTDMQNQLKKSALTQAPFLSEEQINKIAECAVKLVKGLPPFEAKTLNQKKEINKQIYDIVAQPPECLKERLEVMRKYAAIYRRFDSDRVYSKPMSMHEVCVNEAAAQLCLHMPNLLTRREDLFPLARQVVKDSGYQYSKGHSRAVELNPEVPSKRQKLEALISESKGDHAGDKAKREERLRQISDELAAVSEHQEQIVNDLEAAKEDQDMERVDSLQTQLEQITNKHLQLLTEQSELLRKQSMDMYCDFDASSDKDDSNLGASGSSSPSHSEQPESSQGHFLLKNMLTARHLSKSTLTSGAKNTLFDEGLRIAQQYGLGDFAQEIKTLQATPDDECDTDGVSEDSSSFFPSSYENGSVNGNKGSLKSEAAKENEKSTFSNTSIKHEPGDHNGVNSI